MQVDLNDKVTRVLVQEYVNAILNYQDGQELNFNIHKLIHTFEVVQVAEMLLKLTRPALSVKQQKQVINGALLHDIGRCHELKERQKNKKFNHGAMGAKLIKKYLPNLTVEQGCTLWHNLPPTEKDPPKLKPVLDYVRDSDILGNIRYTVSHMPIYLSQIMDVFPQNKDDLILDDEIRQAARHRRRCEYHQMKKFGFLDMIVAQLLWIFNLQTKAGFLLAKQENIFPRYRDVIIAECLPAVSGSDQQRKEMAELILNLFPDELFMQEIKCHEG